jgi:hypothetical protein
MSVRAGCGDDLAVRAAANVSFDRGWTKATARACELVPEIAEGVGALAEDRAPGFTGGSATTPYSGWPSPTSCATSI